MTLRVGIVAGEESGDALGAGLMAAIRRRVDDDVQFSGVGGERMLAEGLEPRAALAELSVNGFVDPIKRFPSLLRILLDLRRHFLDGPVDVVVGVDFNVFNFILERQVKRRGVPTAHYVSPAVYAWRQGRISRIGKSADVVLALFPFEPALYAERGGRAVFVGHPLADRIDLDAGSDANRTRIREQLGIDLASTVFTLMPGSRLSEIEYLGDIFLATARILATRFEDALFVVPCVNDRVRTALEQRLSVLPEPFRKLVRLHEGHAHELLQAGDAALVKSGTGTLEAMLLRRPMVVSYKLGAFTYQMVKALKRSEFIALPNILTDRRLVPELLQDDATPEALADALVAELDRAERDPAHLGEFEAQHRTLRQNASDRAAEAVLALVPGR